MTGAALAGLLETCSVEVTSRDTASLGAVMEHMRPGSEVFVANLPKESADVLVKACAGLRRAGLEPVPHIVARNIPDEAALDDMLARLNGEAGVRTVLSLAGDRDAPAGAFDASLQLIRTGLYGKHGITRVCISAYPEGHPRIADALLRRAMDDKLAALAEAGLEARLVGQFLFDAERIVTFARELRARGIAAPFRVGVAGPAERTKLIRYAIRCGVGTSLRALKERGELARNVMSGETPDALLGVVAAARAAEPALGIEGVHIFTFGDPASAVRWVEAARAVPAGPAAAVGA